MKKALRIYKYAWVVPFFAMVMSMFASLFNTGSSNIHHEGLMKLSEAPAYIEEVIGVELPAVALSNSNTGYGSHFTSHTYKLTFCEPLSEDYVAELERQCAENSEHWEKTAGGLYLYTEYVENGDVIDCLIHNDHMDVGYSISDSEDAIVDAFIDAILLFAKIAIILVAWGVVLLLVALVHKIRHVN